MSNIIGFICIVLALICLIPVLILFGAEAAYLIEGLRSPGDHQSGYEKADYRDESGDQREE